MTRRPSLWIAAATVAGICLLGQPAWATIVSGLITQHPSGHPTAFIKLTLPFVAPATGDANTVGNNSFDMYNLYGFDEDQNILLASDLHVNVGSTIPVGTTVASHYIFWDPPGSSLKTVKANIVFDSAILEIATSSKRLNQSDYLANTGVTYLTGSERGLESGDSVHIDGSNILQIDLSLSADSPGDYIRVFTEYSPSAEVPLPAALPLFAAGLGAFGGVGAWRKRKTVQRTLGA